MNCRYFNSSKVQMDLRPVCVRLFIDPEVRPRVPRRDVPLTVRKPSRPEWGFRSDGTNRTVLVEVTPDAVPGPVYGVPARPHVRPGPLDTHPHVPPIPEEVVTYPRV